MSIYDKPRPQQWKVTVEDRPVAFTTLAQAMFLAQKTGKTVKVRP